MNETNGGGIDRRKLLKIGATTAWVAPAVITSLASPAAAVSTTVIGTACSYVLVVYKNSSGSIFVQALEKGVAQCTMRDTVSADVDNALVNASLAASSCSAYSLVSDDLRLNGNVIPTEGVCRISYVGQTISASAGYQILFTLDHNGSHKNCGTSQVQTGDNKVRFSCFPSGTSTVSTCC